MSRKKHKTRSSADSLLVVAHPDDEALFFAGLLLSTRHRWLVICATDGNADGKGTLRAGQFESSCRKLRAKAWEHWDFPDIFDRRLDVTALTERIKSLGSFRRVFTHGILGEYAHFHHQDVSVATHRAFARRTPVFSVAYNAYPDFRVNLSRQIFKIKTQLLWDIYGSETRKFLNYLPATSTENFLKMSLHEVEAVYSFLSRTTPLKVKSIKAFKWLIPYLEQGGGRLQQRPF